MPKILISLVFLITIVVFSAEVQPTLAASYSTSCSVSLRRTDWGDHCTLNKFDSAKGKLLKVTLDYEGYVEGVIKLENKDATSKTITANYENVIKLIKPKGGELLNVPTTLTFTESFPSYDGTTDFSGDSGKESEKLSKTESGSTTLTSSADLDLFVTTDTATFDATAVGKAELTSSANAAADWDTFASIELSATYEYDPHDPSTPTPKPVVKATPTPVVAKPVAAPQVRGTTCSATVPSCQPEVSSVTVDKDSALVAVGGCADFSQCSQIQLEYGSCSTGFDSKQTFDTPADNSNIALEVKGLDPSTLHTFRARCINSCAYGQYGDSLRGITTSEENSCPYVYSDDLQRPVIDETHEGCAVEELPEEPHSCPDVLAATDEADDNDGGFMKGFVFGFVVASALWFAGLYIWYLRKRGEKLDNNIGQKRDVPENPPHNNFPI